MSRTWALAATTSASSASMTGLVPKKVPGWSCTYSMCRRRKVADLSRWGRHYGLRVVDGRFKGCATADCV